MLQAMNEGSRCRISYPETENTVNKSAFAKEGDLKYRWENLEIRTEPSSTSEQVRRTGLPLAEWQHFSDWDCIVKPVMDRQCAW